MSVQVLSDAKKVPGVWAGQLPHLVCLVALLTLVWKAWVFLGKPFPVAFWCAIAVPVTHQMFVWLAWRLELRSSVTSTIIGFRGYLVAFFLLFGGRFASLAVLAWLDRESLGLQGATQTVLTLLLVSIGSYAAYSVVRYFGLRRAAGGDHFDPQYRNMPLVREGIFRVTQNGMYVYAFFLFWAIAVGFNSTAALTVAAFSHAYIWVHFYTTEKPDMAFLYESL